MWVKWVSGIWDLLTIYGKNEVLLLIGRRTKIEISNSYLGTDGVILYYQLSFFIFVFIFGVPELKIWLELEFDEISYWVIYEYMTEKNQMYIFFYIKKLIELNFKWFMLHLPRRWAFFMGLGNTNHLLILYAIIRPRPKYKPISENTKM